MAVRMESSYKLAQMNVEKYKSGIQMVVDLFLWNRYNLDESKRKFAKKTTSILIQAYNKNKGEIQMEKLVEHIKSLKKTTRVFIAVAVVVALLIVVLLVIFSGSGKTTISAEVTLKKIIVQSQLSTAEYTYNSILEVKDDEKTKYFVSYKGKVKSGIDFEKVEVVQEDNVISIVVPDVEILEVTVDPGLEFIFTKDKYETETVFAEASAACKEDLLAKAKSNKELLETARESAEDALKALVKPFESQFGKDVTFDVVFTAEEANEK